MLSFPPATFTLEELKTEANCPVGGGETGGAVLAAQLCWNATWSSRRRQACRARAPQLLARPKLPPLWRPGVPAAEAAPQQPTPPHPPPHPAAALGDSFPPVGRHTTPPQMIKKKKSFCPRGGLGRVTGSYGTSVHVCLWVSGMGRSVTRWPACLCRKVHTGCPCVGVGTGRPLRCRCCRSPVCWAGTDPWCCRGASPGSPCSPLLWWCPEASPGSSWSRRPWWCPADAPCWSCTRPAWWSPKASLVCPSSRQPCSSSCPRRGLGWRFSRERGGPLPAAPASGTPWPCGSGWAAPWGPASSGGTEGEEGRTCRTGRYTAQSGRRDGGRPPPGTTVCCSCRSRRWWPDASSSAEKRATAVRIRKRLQAAFNHLHSLFQERFDVFTTCNSTCNQQNPSLGLCRAATYSFSNLDMFLVLEINKITRSLVVTPESSPVLTGNITFINSVQQ